MEESAVSEVVGIILIVALTVILAAIIAAYAFGIVGNIPSNNNVIVTIDKTDPIHFILTYRGGADSAKLSSLRFTWPEASLPSPLLPPEDIDPMVGENWGPATITLDGGNHVVVVGHFSDGQEQVLLNSYV
jgi:hypothetical protein